MRKRDRARRILVRTLAFVIFLIVLFISWLIYFFRSNDAPLIYGKVDYHIPFNSAQTLDVYHPTKDTLRPIPVVLYIHGGAWITGNKVSVNNNRFNGAFNRLRESGYAIVSPDYTLARDGRSPFPDNIVDTYDALEWIRENAEMHAFDLDNVVVLGESAGAHLGMLVANAHPSAFGLDYAPFPVTCVVDVYGPVDLMRLYHSQAVDSLRSMLAHLPAHFQESFNLPRLLFGFDPDVDPQRANTIMGSYSPIGYLKRTSPPTLIIHGTHDQVVPFDQSVMLKAVLDSLGVENEWHVLQEVDHAFRGASEEQKVQVQEWIVEYVHRHYRGDP